MKATSGPSQQLINAQKELARRRQLAGVSYRPPAGSVNSEQCSVDSEQLAVNSEQSTVNSQQIRNPKSEIQNRLFPHSEIRIRISPTLAAHCLDKNHRTNGHTLDAPYRLYKILQALDQDGRGWLANQDIEPLLTKKGSSFYIYGRRQLKIILRRGEGLFWNRVKSHGQVRIRLVSRARLISKLSPGSRLCGREVEIPLSYLLGSGRGRQANANAALYAAVHAGCLRPDKGRSGERKPRPISRAKLSELSGCSNYRQRSYERRMDITVQSNIHILGPHNEYELERARLHFGLPAYKHTDYQGKINRHQRGAAYIAVRLPNSYHLPDAITVVNSRRLRTINRFLDGLCHLGSGGSDREEIVRLYHSDAATAVRATQGDHSTPAYWPMTGSGNTRLWQNLYGGRVAGCGREIERFPIPHSAIPDIQNQKSEITRG
jgi:hypothetical protein